MIHWQSPAGAGPPAPAQSRINHDSLEMAASRILIDFHWQFKSSEVGTLKRVTPVRRVTVTVSALRLRVRLFSVLVYT
jgi:hypothetical protein